MWRVCCGLFLFLRRISR
ncbi:MAG: hypothetical protein LBN04_09285 [Oscillospiraceae bacterium]|nr:hypothetical protein [Oscillospiraceae bacterium]